MSKNGYAFIVFIIFAAGILVFYSLSRNEDISTNTSVVLKANTSEKSKSNASRVAPVATESDFREFGFLLNASVEATKKAEGDITFFDLGNGKSITVMPSSDEAVVRNSFGSKSETAITIDGVEGKDIVGTDLKDGGAKRYLLFPRDNRVFFIQGSRDFLDTIDTIIDFQK